MTQLSESSALALLQKSLSGTYKASRRGGIRLGIGDDCAVLQASASQDVWTIDACHEGTHFLWEWMSPRDVAHKSFHAALSDIPAMGAVPRAALCQLTLSSRVDAAWLEEFAHAQAEISRQTQTPLVGGNICFGPQVQVALTILGSLDEDALTRSGAHVGDEIWIIGSLGEARAGLLLLQQTEKRVTSFSSAEEKCLLSFRRPRALLYEGVGLIGRATSAMDVSDGLTRDLARLAKESQVRMVLHASLLEKGLSVELREVAMQMGQRALSLALIGGEDYALLATGKKEERPDFARVIGQVEKGRGAYIQEKGECRELVGGFEHSS